MSNRLDSKRTGPLQYSHAIGCNLPSSKDAERVQYDVDWVF